MQDPGPLVSAAFVAATTRRGLTPDPRLRLLRWSPAGIDAFSSPVPADPFGLGPLHERLVAGEERARRGAWYTPRWLAEDLVRRALGAVQRSVDTVVDPACGGGVFLLAAAERLAVDRSPRAAVGALRGRDLDPLSVAVTEAALWWWSALRGDPTVPECLVVGDALAGTPVPEADVVVGNPPFHGQLRRRTAADGARRSALQKRFGDAVRPYTDPAWLFLLGAVEGTRPGGAVALVQPSSLLGARDAGVIRRRLDERATLVDTWIDDGSTFAASVEACAPVLRVGRSVANDWTAALAESRAIPEVKLPAGSTIGDVALVSAGFRDEYYGLVAAVRAGGDGPRLVTSGAIDPLRLRVGCVTRFAKQRWTDPRVDVDRADGRGARWVASQAGPKLLVATQTRVLEAVVDPGGDLVGSVPVIVVAPRDPAGLWRLAAAVHAPAVSAWCMRRCAGTALSTDACKPTAELLSSVPLPADEQAWDDAASVARAVAGGADRWEELAAAADRAYGIEDPAVRAWWLDRLPGR